MPPVQETLNRIRANVSASTQPRITPTWRIQPNFSADVRLTSASGTIDGIRYSVRSFLQGPLNSAVNEEIRKLNSDVEQNEKIYNELTRFWNKMHQVVQLSTRPSIWMTIQPTNLNGSTPFIDDNEIKFIVGISAKTTLSVGSKPAISLSPLANFTEIENVPKGLLQLALPVAIGWDRANIELQDRLTRDRPLIEGPSGRLHLEEITLEPIGNADVIVTSKFSVEPTGVWGKLLAWIDERLSVFRFKWKLGDALTDQVAQVRGAPVLGTNGVVVSLRDVELTEASTELVKSVSQVYSWLNGERIEALIEQHAVFDLSDTFSNGEVLAQDKLDEISGKLNEFGVELRSEVHKVTRLGSLLVTPDALLTSICAAASADINVLELVEF